VKKLSLLLVILSLGQAATLAQRQDLSADSKNQAAAETKILPLDSNLELVAQLQNTLDVTKAKEGDKVILKTTKTIQANPELVIQKGSTLIGHITRAEKKTRGQNQSSLSMVFDTLLTGSQSLPIHATISSITRLAPLIQSDDSLFGPNQSANTPMAGSRRQQNSGGLLGGVTGSVGGAVGTATSTVGGVGQTLGGAVSSTTNTTVSAAEGVGDNLKGLRILRPAGANASGASTLALTGGNLRLEKGTSFNLLLNRDARVETRDSTSVTRSPRPDKPYPPGWQ
jgi:hypothetical protein